MDEKSTLPNYEYCFMVYWNLRHAQEVLGVVGQDPRDSETNWLHVDIFRFALFI